MLQSIRDRTQGWIAGIIISLLILSFALWGIHSYFVSGPINVAVAEVNGVEISNAALSITYERLKRQIQSQYANYNFSAKAQETLKRHALQSLIAIQVLQQASLKQNYDISQLQVDSFLQSMPEFQVNGQFSFERFQQVLASTLLSTSDFLDLIKTTLLINQPRLGIIFSSFALPNEVIESIALVKQKRDLFFTVLSFNELTKALVSISPENIKVYYQQHQADFKTPEQMTIDYIALSIHDVMNKLHPTEDEIKTFYASNNNLFMTSAKTVEPFEKVKEKVKAVYLYQKAEEQFSDYREKLANAAYEHPESLSFAAQELQLPIQSSQSFSLTHGANDISKYEKIREVAFSHDVIYSKNNSDVVQISPELVIVLRIKSHTAAAVLPLPAVQQIILSKLKYAAASKQTLDQAKQIQYELAHGVSPEQVAIKYHISWNAPGPVERHSNKIDLSILNMAFSMAPPSKGQLVYSITKVINGYAIIGLKAVQNGEPNNNDYPVFAEQIQNSQGLLEYGLYKQSLMRQAKIKIK